MEQDGRLRALKTFYSGRVGLVTLEDDVLSIVSQVRELYGERITVHLDPDSGEYYFVEHCEDGTDRLIFATPELDARALDRLQRADSYSRVYQDPYDAAERAQDELQRQLDEQGRERIREAGERLAHGLKSDGVMPGLPKKVSLYIPNSVKSLDANR